MKTRALLTAAAATAAALTPAAIIATQAEPAAGWQTPGIEAHAAGCERAEITVTNHEGPTHVVSSNVFPVGAAIAAGASLTVTITGTGTLHIVVIVDSPDHAEADLDFAFTSCPGSTTTTSTAPTTTSTQPTTSTSSSTPPPVVQCLGQPAHDRTTGAEPCSPPKVASPHFTG